MEKIKQFITAGLTLLFPPICPSCDTLIENSCQPLCRNCFTELKFISPPYCTCCGRVFPGDGENHLCGICLKSSWAFDKARSIFAYEKIIADLIHRLKYSGDMTGLGVFRYLSRDSSIPNDLSIPDFILPVPLHTKRLRGRGFNQALLLARTLFPEEQEKIKCDILLRQTDTPTQTGLSGIERRKNLKNAFVVKDSSEIIARNILIIDDVFTTGSTVNECAKALKTAGCNRVEVLTICRADKLLT